MPNTSNTFSPISINTATPVNFDSSRFRASKALFERAAKVIPGGIYGHASPASGLPGGSPYYAERAEGCRYWDADGNEYIDFLCGYGPIILGYSHPEVEESAERQRRSGNCFNHPTSKMVELAEFLVDEVDFADWAVFGKNGTDMTTWAMRVAREATQRKMILRVRGAYHGMDAWSTPGYGGITEEDRAPIRLFSWNDLEQFEETVKAYRNRIAGVIMTPFHHPFFADCVMPEKGFFETIEATCRREGIVFILDDIRAGFRLHPGGSHRVFGFEPDLICFSKALGNGYPISATLGRKALRKPAGKVFLTGSFWNSAVPMAASLTCLQILKRDRVAEHLKVMGDRLRRGLKAMGGKYSMPFKCSGPPAVPFARIENEENFFLQQEFCRKVMERGVYFHPHHNWFLSAAHQKEDIDSALGVVEGALAAMVE